VWGCAALGTIVVVLALIGLGAEDAVERGTEVDRCVRDSQVLLLAQSVPTAQAVPCFTGFVDDWVPVEDQVDDTGASFRLHTTELGGATWTLEFSATCQPDPAAQPVPWEEAGGPPGIEVSQTVDQRDRSYREVDWFRFPGGCVRSEIEVAVRLDRGRVFADVDEMLRFVSRADLDAEVRRATDGELPLDPPSAT
jgi:hypothetical protein